MGDSAGQQRPGGCIHPIAKAQRKGGKHALRGVFEDRREALADPVYLATAIEFDVLGRDCSIQRQVTRRTRRCNTETAGQVRSPDLTEKVEPKVDVGQPLALGMAQTFTFDALGGHGQTLLIHVRRQQDRKRKFDCTLAGTLYHQNDDIMNRPGI